MYLVHVSLWPLPHLPVSPTISIAFTPSTNKRQFFASGWGMVQLCGQICGLIEIRTSGIWALYNSQCWLAAAVIWLQLCGWCVGPEREVNKAGKKGGGHMWIAHMDVHAQSPVQYFSQLWVHSVSPSNLEGERGIKLFSTSLLVPPTTTHTHSHKQSQAHTCTRFSQWFRDVTSGWVWSVSKGLDYYSPLHTHTTHKPQTEESLSQAGDSSTMEAAVNDSAQCGLKSPQDSLIQTCAFTLLYWSYTCHTHNINNTVALYTVYAFL